MKTLTANLSTSEQEEQLWEKCSVVLLLDDGEEDLHTESASRVHTINIIEAIDDRMKALNKYDREDADQDAERAEHLNRELKHARDTSAVAEERIRVLEHEIQTE
ncbi:uncharacterized protein EV154DRAFT_477736 [Mucor mucedo]|uniref:uncharacterized protein n=1 Tax=Mucor mucedo TaxID=29922 RepID=UPI00221FF0F4|nr:uncharacterized protein EV154DRAFT_477736 [Mucor mucedo]KAI7894957.1 hypothetical protein EV154DRAFT_477736 [Mucor mucedo]